MILHSAEMLLLLTGIANLKHKSFMVNQIKREKVEIYQVKAILFFFFPAYENKSSRFLFWIEIWEELCSYTVVHQNTGSKIMDDGFGNLLLFRRFAFSSKKLNRSGLFRLNLVRAKVMKKKLKI